MDTRPVVVSMRRGGRRPGGGPAVRIDRRTAWGNPYPMRGYRSAERARVIRLYARSLRASIQRGAVTRAALAALLGHELICWCAPLPCHGDVLADAAVAAGGSDKEWAAWLAAGAAERAA